MGVPTWRRFHAVKVVAAIADSQSGELAMQRMGGQTEQVADFCAALPAPVRVAYEAGPTGFGTGGEGRRNSAAVPVVTICQVRALVGENRAPFAGRKDAQQRRGDHDAAGAAGTATALGGAPSTTTKSPDPLMLLQARYAEAKVRARRMAT